MTRLEKRTLAYGALYALIPVLLLVLPYVLRGMGQGEPYGAAQSLEMVLLEFGVIALPLCLVLAVPRGRELCGGLWLKRPGWEILLVLPLAVCAYAFINGITLLWVMLLSRLGLSQVQQAIALPQNGGQLLVGLFTIALIPAVCEEFFFRGGLQPALHRGLRPAAAIVLGGCLFGLVHGQFSALPAHVLLGMGLCLVAYWTRSVWYTMVWHAVQNALSLAAGLFAAQLSDSTGMLPDTTQIMQQLLEQPGLYAASAAYVALSAGGLVLMLLTVLWLCVRKKAPDGEAPLQEDDRPRWFAYLPFAAALVCIVYSYVLSACAMAGGAA